MGRPRDPKVEGVVGHRKFEKDFRETRKMEDFLQTLSGVGR